MTTFLRFLINGISLGSVYAIIALGYTMVYGIAKMLNFAHGDVIMIGAYVSFCAMQYLSLPPLVSVILAMAVCTVLGVIIEGLAYRPLRQAASLAVLRLSKLPCTGSSYQTSHRRVQDLKRDVILHHQLHWRNRMRYSSHFILGSIHVQPDGNCRTDRRPFGFCCILSHRSLHLLRYNRCNHRASCIMRNSSHVQEHESS